jgi:hypothetical protein
MENYEVKFKVNHTNSRAILKLHGDSESEAISLLKQRGTVPKDADVIILSIKQL